MIYITKDLSKLLLINLKCAYSTCDALMKKGHLIKVNIGYDNKKLNPDVIKSLWASKHKHLRDLPTYIVVRDPVARVLSFYQDKFVNNAKVGDKILWQDCQKKILNYTSIKRILDRQFTFSEFVTAIKKGYWDDHIGNQADLFNLYKDNNKINVIKMDSIDFNSQIAMVLNLSPEDIPRANDTHSENKLGSIKGDDREYLRKLYGLDVKVFGY